MRPVCEVIAGGRHLFDLRVEDRLVQTHQAGLLPGPDDGQAPCGGVHPDAACHLVLYGLHSGRGAQAVERSPQDRLEVAGLTVDLGDGDDQVEDLCEGEVVADLVSALRGGEERSAGGDHAGAAVVE